VALLAALAALLLVAIALLIFLLLRKGEKVTDATRLPSPGQPAVLSAPVRPATPESKPPPEVVAYLEHVRKIEGKRRDMRLDLTPAFDMLKQAEALKGEVEDEERSASDKSISSGVDEYTKQWQDLTEEFNSVNSPPQCAQLAGAYSTALGKYSAAMIKIQVSYQKKDIGALMGMQGSAQADVDTSLIQADQELSTVCTNYGIKKTFAISPDKGMDSLFSPLP